MHTFAGNRPGREPHAERKVAPQPPREARDCRVEPHASPPRQPSWQGVGAPSTGPPTPKPSTGHNIGPSGIAAGREIRPPPNPGYPRWWRLVRPDCRLIRTRPARRGLALSSAGQCPPLQEPLRAATIEGDSDRQHVNRDSGSGAESPWGEAESGENVPAPYVPLWASGGCVPPGRSWPVGSKWV